VQDSRVTDCSEKSIKFEVKTNSSDEDCIPFLAAHLALVDETWQFLQFGVQQQTL
jgi:hypothetical protein